MYALTVRHFDEWRDLARQALQAQIPPHALQWDHAAQSGLFADNLPEPTACAPPLYISRQFMQQAQITSFHRHQDKWALLYRLLWRTQHETRHILRIATDDDVIQLKRYIGEVRRDAHKMKAFVRFREVPDVDNAYIAWHEPSHPVVRYTAPFFTRRFAAMRWAILTPDESAYWDGNIVRYGEGVARSQAPTHDDMEALWVTFYRHIFNPARIKTEMMRSEMPRKYWHTMPETAHIPSMLEEADARVAAMIDRHELPE